jgi:hypothetical protein
MGAGPGDTDGGGDGGHFVGRLDRTAPGDVGYHYNAGLDCLFAVRCSAMLPAEEPWRRSKPERRRAWEPYFRGLNGADSVAEKVTSASPNDKA